MSDNVTRLHRPVPVPELPQPSADDLARRVALQQAVAPLVDCQPSWARSDAERLALTAERLGDVAAAFNRGHADLEGELLKLWATVQAWSERLERERAR